MRAALPDADLKRLLALFQARRFDAMERLARDLVQAHPEAGMGWKALGIALQAQGRDALAALQRATELLPQDAEIRAGLVEAWLVRGHASLKAGRAEEAAACYAEAAALDDRHAHAHGCLGIALRELGRHEAAVGSLRRALDRRPDLLDSAFCLADSLLALDRAEEALTPLRHVLAARPDQASAHAALGNALKRLGRHAEALASYRQAIALQPESPLHHGNLAAACRELGRLEEALAGYQRVFDLDPNRLDALSDRLFILNHLPDATPRSRLAEARRYGELAAARARAYTRWPVREPSAEPARLRIGFVSADLHEHPVGYFIENVIGALATDEAGRVDLRVYANSRIEDGLTRRLRLRVPRWADIDRLDDAAAAALIRSDGTDVLVDLAGHTAGNRLPLFAWKPAPLQVGWLGYCATTGVAAIDAVLVDPWIVPPGAEGEFTESAVRLPDTFLCFTPPPEAPAVAPLPALARGHVTFGCFNKLNKLGDAVVATWARILEALPDSRLLLKAGPLGSAEVRAGMEDRFAARGIAAERLVLEGASPRADYLRAYDQVDIALDPFPYPGGTTSIEGLWMGVPMVTLTGDSALARQGVGLLRNVDLPEWIAADVDDYVARAVRHAGAIQALAELRRGLRARLLASPLCDAGRFARHFVDALQALARERRCALGDVGAAP